MPDSYAIVPVTFKSIAGTAARAWRDERMPMREYARPSFRLGAVRDGELVGCVTVVQQGRYGRLCSLYVAPEYRGAGIGQALIEAAADESRVRGVRKLEARSLHADLFQRAGFSMTPRLFAPLPDGSVYRQFLLALD